MEFLREIDSDHGDLANDVYEELKKHILNGNFKPGDRLVENKLATAFGISRTPVRDAISRLKKEGLIMDTNNGVRVTEISLEDIEKIYDLRSVLEVYAIDLIIDNLHPTDIIQLEGYIKKAEIYIEEENIDKVFKVNTQFHNYLYKITDDKRLQKFIKELNDSILRYRYIVLYHNDQPTISLKEHKKIVSALKDRNKELAKEYIKEDIEEGKSAILKLMKENKSKIKSYNK